MNPYLVDVGEIGHVLSASVEIDETIETGDFAVGETVFAAAGPAKVRVTVTNTGAGIVAMGNIDTDFRIECSRCLELFVLHVTGDVEGFYTTVEKAQELPEDMEWEPLEGPDVDIAHALEAAVRIALPFVPLHSPDCKGICPECGADLNAGTCECEPVETHEGPFSALKTLLSDEDATGE